MFLGPLFLILTLFLTFVGTFFSQKYIDQSAVGPTRKIGPQEEGP